MLSQNAVRNRKNMTTVPFAAFDLPRSLAT